MFLNYFRQKTEFIFENKIKNPKKIFQYKYICHSIFFQNEDFHSFLQI